MKKLLIASANKGKVKEIRHALADAHFEVIAVSDLDEPIPEPEEYGKTFEENAVIKAKYYGKKTGMISLADDGGLCVDALDGWPGVISARIAKDADTRCDAVIKRISEIGLEESKATFVSSMALFDPQEDSLFVGTGRTQGTVHTKVPEKRLEGFGYDPIFFVDKVGKTYDEMSVAEKNRCSHRGKALSKVRYHIAKSYSPRQLAVACAVILRDGKMLLQQRSDPHRPEFHEKWEFPGGIVDYGDSIRDTVIREVKEEVGYDVVVKKGLEGHAQVQNSESPRASYQVFLHPFICEIVGGKEALADAEVLQVHWVNLEEVSNYDLVGDNSTMFTNMLPHIRDYLT